MPGSPYPEPVTEVDHLPDAAPSPEALAALVEALDAFTSKRNITLLAPEEIPAGAAPREGAVRTVDEVRAFHARTFGSDPDPWILGNGTRAYHVLYLDSHLWMEHGGEKTATAGVAMENVIVAFRGAAAPDLRAADREVATLLHEAGHAMRLVGRGAPEVRARSLPDDPAHSANPRSVMYASAERLGGTSAGAAEGRASPLDLFDADDKADLAALRAEETRR